MQQIAHMSSTHFEGQDYNESLYRCSWGGVHHVKNWERNRNPERNKVEEIKKAIKNGTHTASPLSGFMILNRGEKPEVIIYDGSHRLLAYKELTQNGNKCEFEIYIQALMNPPEKLIIERFRNVNKVSPVTELYTEANKTQENLEMCRKIVDIGKRFRRKYKHNVSTSENPHNPNYNIYQLQEDIRRLLIENDELNALRECEIMNIFEKINEIFRERISSLELFKNPKLLKQVEKAMKADCFIFVYGRNGWVDEFTKMTSKKFNNE